jgi:hypothetical protein
VVDPDFAMLMNHKVAGKIFMDVELAGRFMVQAEHALANRRQK